LTGNDGVGEWYYIGHYGQLGPLTREQIDELIESGVVARETYVWRAGMGDWLPADRAPELMEAFRRTEPYNTPPPPPMDRPPAMPTQPIARSYGYDAAPVAPSPNYPAYNLAKSDKSRTLGGVLQLLIPGVGRIYLGYSAIGVLQLVLTPCMGIGYVWSLIDGIVVLAGGVKLDGYGRSLND